MLRCDSQANSSHAHCRPVRRPPHGSPGGGEVWPGWAVVPREPLAPGLVEEASQNDRRTSLNRPRPAKELAFALFVRLGLSLCGMP